MGTIQLTLLKLLTETQSKAIGHMMAPTIPTGNLASGGALPPLRMAASVTLFAQNGVVQVAHIIPRPRGMNASPWDERSLFVV
jgi:hypothetical protein